MPFKSKKQMKAAFGGHMGKKMQTKAKEWADETPNIKELPAKVQVAQKSPAKRKKKVSHYRMS